MKINIKNKQSFTDKFIAKFLENGFGSLPKREIEIYIMNLLLEDGQFINKNGDIDYHEVSLILRLSETKVRNLIYEVELKYKKEHSFINQLIELIEKNKYESIDGKVKFNVQSPLLKQSFEYEVRQLPNSISDGSFAKNIVTITNDTFEKLLKKLFIDEQKISNFIKSLPENKKEIVTDKDSLFREFTKEFLKTSGSRSADLVFDFINPINLLKGLLSND